MWRAKGLAFPENRTWCHWGSEGRAPLKCPAFSSLHAQEPLRLPAPRSVSVFCSMNKYYVVWCSLLSDMKKGNSLGWRRRGRETPFFTRCIKRGYTDLNSQKSNKTVKIMIKQLLGWQLCNTRDHWRQSPALQQDNVVDHMVPLQASCWIRWLAFVLGTRPAWVCGGSSETSRLIGRRAVGSTPALPVWWLTQAMWKSSCLQSIHTTFLWSLIKWFVQQA